ncbi:MAG: L-glutamate gamma-semialdehyde dehydrogenase [Phycisphaerae bacterium]|nr:MAG: L-glutamate gamma-semialdehyde dehydrogenase [Planctomycetota bacterium]KAB2939463.1 MAG: L-glutamate gamma-semialdehyde dehydrogenase [Phycisphaerae bacterium]MBE7455817.1 L-glutamate gamma-semialdehyde dehydrogenase [Planctomycetia bacterium]MCK6463452.1 L-glutamate gamma-semialdehyde dehydrogenase [Phycisphaerae bacterium]MCL4717075.1 L-glutamate gamma-semialdehyde dehydrogenase [Phycisphaerae bacterium]
MLTTYRPEPYVDFSQPEPRQRMLDALALVKSQLGRTYPLWVAGEAVTTKETFASVSPADPNRVVGVMCKADAGLADRAVRAAAETFKTWSRVDPDVRARVLIKTAAIMRRRVYELSAWMCYEVSKSWIEAYADTCETIDFLDFYGREMMRLGGSQPVTPYPGEENELRYIPLGVGVVIPPWNFPLAICTGMTSAALVCGNTVCLKPASTSPVIAAKMLECLHEAGLPKDVVNFVPGPGASVGDTMVTHPLTRFISFTGSRDVGVGIYEKASKVQKGQIWLKRSVLEMGGKDCIVVDETADVEAAAEGVVASAFGFQGQKCSACSRLIAHQDVYADLLDRVVARTKKLTIGDTVLPDNFFMGAVIDDKAYAKINEYIRIGQGEGRWIGPLSETRVGPLSERPEKARSESGPAQGYFIPPTIIEGVAPNARLAQEEIFGPVLAVIKAKNFEDGLAIANGTEYGLTGALYSRDRFRLERARHEFHVGNLYLNRKCTGALVDVQPFGGFNMSGTDSKAGGRDYLLLFLQGKSITERW